MRRWLVVMALVALVGVVASAHPRTSGAETAAKEDDIRKLEQQWLDAAAVPDLPTLRKLIAADFMGTSFGGKKVLTKVDVVPEDDFDTSHMPKCTLKDSTVKIFGDTAVLMGQVEMQVPENPETIRMTTVFQKRGDGWQVIAVHMSKAPAA